MPSLTTTSPSPSPQKILLLQGDQYQISPNGISRTLYKLSPLLIPVSIDAQNYRHPCHYSVEEEYDLNSAHKTFLIRKMSTNTLKPGRTLHTIRIQEIQNGIMGTAGTGSSTWESSIAMSLYFSTRPALLKGQVLELGSGVGLAGLLTRNLLCRDDSHWHNVESFTLSDYSAEVIQQCRENLRNNSDDASFVDMDVCHINWYDFIQDGAVVEKKYDTIIASDIAYRRMDIVPMAATLSSHLKKNDGSESDNKSIHMFGPNNRAVLHELIDELRKNWEVRTELISMERCRLKPVDNNVQDSGVSASSLNSYASKQSTDFLHVTITQRSTSGQEEYPDISDID